MGEVIVIEPGRHERNNWRDLWRYRELFRVLAWRDLAGFGRGVYYLNCARAPPAVREYASFRSVYRQSPPPGRRAG
jgi:hypothetical protein